MFTWILASVLLMLNLCLWIGNICNGLLLGNASIARGLTCCKKLARHEASRKSWSTKFPLGGEVNHIWPLAYEESLGPSLSIERTAKPLIRLGGCPGWSESSLGAHVSLLVLSWGGWFILFTQMPSQMHLPIIMFPLFPENRKSIPLFLNTFEKWDPPDIKFYLSKLTNKNSPYGVSVYIAIDNIQKQRKKTQNLHYIIWPYGDFFIS